MHAVVANLSVLPRASMPRTPSTRARCPAETVIGGAAIVRRPGVDVTDVEDHDVDARRRRSACCLRAGPGSRRATRITRLPRSEERRRGKECASTWRSVWAPQHKKKNRYK